MDAITLARLVDECREEREHLQLMEVADDKSSQLTVYRQSELSMMQLAAVDQTSKELNEADQLLSKIALENQKYNENQKFLSQSCDESLAQLQEFRAKMNRVFAEAAEKAKDQKLEPLRNMANEVEMTI